MHSPHLACDDAQQRARVRGRDQPDLLAAKVLVARLCPLLRARQVDPQLQAVEQPARLNEPLRRPLDVQEPIWSMISSDERFCLVSS